MANQWIEHVRKFRAKNPKMPYKDVLKNARASYKPKSASTAGGSKKPIKNSPARKTKKVIPPADE